MPVVTLTTDWGTKDFYVGAFKGALLSQSPELNLIDISHFVQSFDLLNGAFIFRNAWGQFPEGTVHVIGITAQAEAGLIAVKHKNQFFIGMNDGFFSLAFDEIPEEIISLKSSAQNYAAFDHHTVAKTAAFLAMGGDFNSLGRKPEHFIQKTHLQPVIEDNIIKGTVIYIDTFENVITNITQELFARAGKGKNFEILLRKREYTITEVKEKYSDVQRGQLLALFNTSGYLEIAINQGNASGLLGLNYGDIIRIDFK